MSRFTLCLLAFASMLCVGCIEPDKPSQPERDLFDLPKLTTPKSNRLSVREANGYHRFQKEFHELDLQRDQPGFSGRQMKILIPDDPNAKSLPCLFYNPPGATAFTGKSARSASEEPMIPYVHAGFVVVIYGTAGGTIEVDASTSAKSLAQQAELYAQSHAGLINCRNAVDFVLEEFSIVDPERMYSIGHSSGGKQALLMAAADQRIAGCVAWAPACDVSRQETQMIDSLRRYRRDLPVAMLHQSSPSKHADRIEVPLLLVHSAQDEIVPSSDVRQFAQAVGSNAEIQSVRSQSHFDVPEVAEELTLRWLVRQATANGGKLANVKTVRKSSPQVRNVSRSGSSGVRKSSSAEIQSNPYAN